MMRKMIAPVAECKFGDGARSGDNGYLRNGAGFGLMWGHPESSYITAIK